MTGVCFEEGRVLAALLYGGKAQSLAASERGIAERVGAEGRFALEVKWFWRAN